MAQPILVDATSSRGRCCCAFGLLAAAAEKLGIDAPRTVVLPNKSYVEDVTGELWRRLDGDAIGPAPTPVMSMRGSSA